MENKFTIVTGATGGLGSAFCHELASAGKNLIITATNDQRLETFKNKLLSMYPKIDILVCKCDMSNELSRKQLFGFLKSSNKQIEMLINNAGYITEGAVVSVTAESLIQAVRVNCEGTIDLTKFIVDNHNPENSLTILTVASLAAIYPMPYMGVYAASKSFLLSFMTALGVEVKDKNIRVTTVLPSGIYTTQAMKEAIKSQGVGGKLSSSSPENIAKYALKQAKKGKTIIVPGAFNRFTRFISNFATYPTLAKITGKRWHKSQKKRDMIK